MGYTQRELSTLLQLKSPSRISQWENGERLPSIQNLIKLSILYHTLVGQLYYDLRQSYLTEFEKQHADSENNSDNQAQEKPP